MRRRFRLGWALAFGLASVVVTLTVRGSASFRATTTVVANPLASDATLTLLLYGGCAIAGGAGAFMAISSLETSSRARRLSAMLWTAVTVAVVAANTWLMSPASPEWWYDFATGSGMSPGVLMLHLTLPIAGAVGGLIQSLVSDAPRAATRLVRALEWMAVWALAFLIAARLCMLGVYLGAGVTDIFEALNWSARAGKILGVFAGGAVGGYIAGAVASWSSGLRWRDAAASIRRRADPQMIARS